MANLLYELSPIEESGLRNRMLKNLQIIVMLGLLVNPHCVAAIEKSENVFNKVSSSTYVIIALNSSGESAAQGSGVLVGPRTIVTNCHVVEDANTVITIRESKKFQVTVKNQDLERDLCTLTGKELPSISNINIRPSKTLRRGEAVFAVGAPLGLDLSISNGIVSGLRNAKSSKIVQTTAAISPGSSGGGLYDADGNLIGITTYQYINGQNINFALPSEWISQISVREALEKQLRVKRKAFNDDILSIWGENTNKSRETIIRLSEEYLLNDKNYVPALYYLGTTLFQVDPTEDRTVSVLESVIDKPANSIIDYHNIGVSALFLSEAYLKLGKSNEARIAAGKAAQYIPGKVILGRYWGMLESEVHFEEALSVFLTATSLFPESPEAWAYLAGAQKNTSQRNLAIVSFEKAIELKPDYEWAWLGYIITIKETRNDKKLEEAVKYLYENNQPLMNKILSAMN